LADHTHADAVLAITDTKDGEQRVREVYGKETCRHSQVPRDGETSASFSDAQHGHFG
jgi:hypothetical protein